MHSLHVFVHNFKNMYFVDRGLDFHKDYRRVCEIVSFLIGIPNLMLTATATNAVKEDVFNVLAIQDASVIARLPNRY